MFYSGFVIYNLNTLWNMYLLMRTIHGVYITYSFFVWLMGSMSAPFLYVLSFMYNPYEVKQIEDKKIILDEVD